MLRFDLSDSYKGIGISQGLDRGLLVYDDNLLLVEEGMGFGSCALQTAGRTYFTSIKEFKRDGVSFHMRSSIDMKLEVNILGINSPFLTLVHEHAVKNLYMKHAKRQEQLLRLGSFLGKLFNMKTYFLKVPTLGEVTVIYKLGEGNILVDLSFETEIKDSRLFVLNELGGSIFDQSIINGIVSDPPSGWQKIEAPCELYSRKHGLSFTIVEKHIPDNVKSKLYWGREQIRNHCCWAGFENEIVCESGKFENYIYSIELKVAK